MRCQEVARGVFAMLAEDSTANAGFVVGGDKVLVVDTMMLPVQSKELAVAVGHYAAGGAKLVVNTHWHSDHTFGNMLFPDAAIMAHRTVRRRMEEAGEGMIERASRLRPEHAAEFRSIKIMPPALCYTHAPTLHLGSCRVDLFHPGMAHTDGDTAVYFPEERVLFAGDLLFARTVPAVLPETNTEGWVKVLAELENLPIETVVPGHGPLSTVQDMRALRAYLEYVQGAVRRGLSRGLNKEGTVNAVSIGPAEGWDKAERHATGVGQIYDELSQNT